jgi:WD40 repeat protein
MIDEQELFDRAVRRFAPPERSFDRLVRRRDVKRRNRRIAAAVVALGIFAGVVAYLGASIGLPKDTPATPAPLPYRHNGEIAVFEQFGSGIRLESIDPETGRRATLRSFGSDSPRAEGPAWSPDGSEVAYVFAGHLWILDVATGQSRDVAFCGSCGGGGPSWSPDGSTIAVSGGPNGSTIDLFDVATGARSTLQPLEAPGRIVSLAWSPDGDRIAFIDFGAPVRKLYTVRIDGSDLRAIAEDALFSVTWSPDGSSLAYLVSPDWEAGCIGRACPIRVMVVGADGSAARMLFSPGRYHYFNFVPGLAWSPDGTQLALVIPQQPNRSALFVISADGTNSRVLLKAAHGRPSWRPVP